MKKLLLFFLVFFMVENMYSQTTPYRIKMASSTYTAQLRGVTGTATAGLTITGVYSTALLRHEFGIATSGLYELWFDILGGSNYSKDVTWSGSYGKPVSGYDFSVGTGTNNFTYSGGLLAADTNAFATLGADTLVVGDVAYLVKLSSGNTLGGGFFIWSDSIHAETAYTNGYVYAGSTATGQWVRDEFKQNGYVKLDWYGAAIDGVTDDVTAITNFLNSGHPLKLESGKTSKFTGTITITGQSIDMSTTGSEKFTFEKTDATGAFIFQGVASDTSALTANAVQGSQEIVVGSSGGDYNVGELIKLISQNANDWYITGSNTDLGEMHTIAAITADTLYLRGHVNDRYYPGTYKVMSYTPIEVNLSNIYVNYSTAQTVTAITIKYAKENNITNIKIKGSRNAGISFVDCFNNSVESSSFEGIDKSDLGYAIRFDGCNQNIVSVCHFVDCFKGVELSNTSTYGAPTRNTAVTDCFWDGTGYSDTGVTLYSLGNRLIHSHEGAETIYASGNIILNSYYSIFGRSADWVFTNNIIRGNAVFICDITKGGNIDISNNNYNFLGWGRSAVEAAQPVQRLLVMESSARIDSNMTVNIEGNKIVGISQDPVYIKQDTLFNFTYKNNDFSMWLTSGTEYEILGNPTVLRNYNIGGNTMRLMDGATGGILGGLSSGVTFSGAGKIDYWNGNNKTFVNGVQADSLKIAADWFIKVEYDTAIDSLYFITATDTLRVDVTERDK